MKESEFTLEPGQSAFLDMTLKIVAQHKGNRHQICATVVVLDDADAACTATEEVFDERTGKTSVFLRVTSVTTTCTSQYTVSDIATNQVPTPISTTSNSSEHDRAARPLPQPRCCRNGCCSEEASGVANVVSTNGHDASGSLHFRKVFHSDVINEIPFDLKLSSSGSSLRNIPGILFD